MPSIDVAPATPGVQTAVLGAAQGLAINGLPGGGFGTSFATVNQAPATIVTQAAPQSVGPGNGFSDLATVTGSPGAPTPTGTVVFQLFGPVPPPGQPTCTGAPFDISAAVP